MNRACTLLLAFLFSIAAVGCDSLDKEDERERIEGSWNVTRFTTGSTDVSTHFEQFGEVTATFDDGDFAFTGDPAEGGDLDLLSGEYTISPAGNGILFQSNYRTEDGTRIPLAGTYEFEGENTLEITVPAALIGAVANIYIEPDIQFSENLMFRLERD